MNKPNGWEDWAAALDWSATAVKRMWLTVCACQACQASILFSSNFFLFFFWLELQQRERKNARGEEITHFYGRGSMIYFFFFFLTGNI